MLVHYFIGLDHGAGKEIDLTDCPRKKLKKQCVKYLGPIERNQYEYIVAEGKIVHNQSSHELHTKGGPEEAEAKWIFVMSPSGRLYIGKKEKGKFHHSSFLAGGATIAAGSLVAEHGFLKFISRNSGHYQPGGDSLDRFLSFLGEHGVNLDGVRIGKANEDYGN
uniref:Uncharacterized protein n=1 Tax=Fagus sylvatica TaxID=28930 RepID=A0A2N9IDQ3_FAGSY